MDWTKQDTCPYLYRIKEVTCGAVASEAPFLFQLYPLRKWNSRQNKQTNKQAQNKTNLM